MMAAENTKIPCRCLLKEAGEKELAQSIAEYVNTLNEEIRADDDLYQKRLKICSGCGKLLNGTCQKCGCYVEMRAAVRTNHCPSEEKLW